jgi:hypothetical protein
MEYMNNKLVKGIVKNALAASLAFVSLSSIAAAPNTAPTDIVFGLPVDIVAGNDLIEVNGTGNFGIQQPVGYYDALPLDVSSVFSNGFNFYSTNYSAVNQFKFGGHGQVMFHSDATPFLLLDPNSTEVGQDYFSYNGPSFGLHPGLWCPLCSAVAASPGGNSTGTSRVYTHLDPINNVVTITYDDVINLLTWNDYWTPNKNSLEQEPTAAQMRFHDIGSGNFVLEFRYENIGWGKSGVAGWSNDDNTNFVTLDQNTDYSTSSNIGQPGVYAWMFVNGQYVESTDTNKVLENSVNGTTVGALATTDVDANETFTYTLLDDAEGRFTLLVDNGITYVVVADGGIWLDFSDNETHDIRVRVTDSGALPFEKTLTINVIKAPVFNMSTDIRVPVDTAMNLTIQTNVEQGSGIPTITATGLPAWMNFSDNNDGTVTLSGFPSFELTFRVTLTVTDGFGNETTRTFNVTVTPEPVDPEALDSGITTTETITVTVTDEDGKAGSFGWLMLLLVGGLMARRKIK